MPFYIVRYAEIALKGNNRPAFEQQLVDNICRVLGLPDNRVRRQPGQILVGVTPDQVESARQKLATVSGIAWYAPVQVCGKSLTAIRDAAHSMAAHLLDSESTFAVKARRTDNKVSFGSEAIYHSVGAVLHEHSGATVDLGHPDVLVNVTVRKDASYVWVEKMAGPGGLPVGTSEPVLSLLSGGFDSIASSYLLARRGAQVDFLHFHAYPNVSDLLTTKMPDLWRGLSQYTLSEKVFLADYAPFQIATLGHPHRYEKNELIVFRRLMVRVGAQLADKHGYRALVLGDSLGQVASQTMENMSAVDEVVGLPIFRPLIGLDKVEIIDMVSGLDLEQIGAADYRDCCSIVSRNTPATPDLERVHELEALIEVEALADAVTESLVEMPVSDPQTVSI